MIVSNRDLMAQNENIRSSVQATLPVALCFVQELVKAEYVTRMV
jgi:hypothetical protein